MSQQLFEGSGRTMLLIDSKDIHLVLCFGLGLCLYNHVRIAEFLKDIELKELTRDHMEIKEAPIDLEEINKAIANLSCNSSPGLAGLTPEFYKRFAQVLAGPLQEVFNQCLVDGKIPPPPMETNKDYTAT